MSEISIETMESLAYRRAKRLLGEDEAQKICKKTTEEWEKLIATNSTHVLEVKEKVKAADAYKKAEQVIGDFRSALRDKLKEPKAVIELCTWLNYQNKENNDGSE